MPDIDFGITVDPESERKIILRFQKFPQAVHDRLLATLWSIERRLASAVIAAEPVDKGQLREMTGGRVYDHDTRIAAVVGVRAPDKKAASLEYGAHRPHAVKTHMMRLDHFWALAVSPRMVEVPTFQRTPNIVEQRFLRNSVRAIAATAVEEMRQAVGKAVDDAG
jgi:hypothetical protein